MTRKCREVHRPSLGEPRELTRKLLRERPGHLGVRPSAGIVVAYDDVNSAKGARAETQQVFPQFYYSAPLTLIKFLLVRSSKREAILVLVNDEIPAVVERVHPVKRALQFIAEPVLHWFRGVLDTVQGAGFRWHVFDSVRGGRVGRSSTEKCHSRRGNVHQTPTSDCRLSRLNSWKFQCCRRK